MSKFTILLAGCLMAFGAGADTIISPLSAENQETYFEISDVSIEKVGNEVLDDNIHGPLLDECSSGSNQPFAAQPNNGLDTVLIDQIINYAQKVWDVIVANKPVMNLSEMTANALPQGINCWTGLSNWELPNSTVYHVSYKNGFGMEVVNFKFRLFYTYGGKFEEVGSYLANVSVTPMQVDVAWGFEFNAHTEVEQVLNIGPLADPVAGMELAMKWRVDTPFKASASQVRYFVTGDGRDKEYN